MDFGCATGSFTLALADMVGKDGLVIAADLQQDMLDKLSKKSTSYPQIKLHKGTETSIGYSGQLDFINAFYVIHELHDLDAFFSDAANILKPDGTVLMIEPMVHVTGEMFDENIALAKKYGLTPITKVSVHLSMGVLLGKHKP